MVAPAEPKDRSKGTENSLFAGGPRQAEFVSRCMLDRQGCRPVRNAVIDGTVWDGGAYARHMHFHRWVKSEWPENRPE